MIYEVSINKEVDPELITYYEVRAKKSGDVLARIKNYGTPQTVGFESDRAKEHMIVFAHMATNKTEELPPGEYSVLRNERFSSLRSK